MVRHIKYISVIFHLLKADPFQREQLIAIHMYAIVIYRAMHNCNANVHVHLLQYIVVAL